jgi:hypothetical protein
MITVSGREAVSRLPGVVATVTQPGPWVRSCDR